MSVYLAHGLNANEIKKYSSVDETKDFSVAEYFGEEGKPKLSSFQHEHEEYEFIIPLKTIPLMKYEKANYIGEVGFCYPVNPFVNHGVEFELENSHVISITVSKKFVDARKEKLGFKDKYFYTRFLYDKDLLIAIQKFQEAVRNESSNRMIPEVIATKLLDYLIAEGLSSGEDNRRPEKVYTKNIRHVIVYMFANYRDPELNVVKLAEYSGYSVSYFSRAFKAYMGDSPVVHLNKLRLSEAKELFKDKNLTLGEIAVRVGYKNLSTFTEAFKSIIGMKPKKYRDKYC